MNRSSKQHQHQHQPKSIEQVYYAKLINFDRSAKNEPDSDTNIYAGNSYYMNRIKRLNQENELNDELDTDYLSSLSNTITHPVIYYDNEAKLNDEYSELDDDYSEPNYFEIGRFKTFKANITQPKNSPATNQATSQPTSLLLSSSSLSSLSCSNNSIDNVNKTSKKDSTAPPSSSSLLSSSSASSCSVSCSSQLSSSPKVKNFKPNCLNNAVANEFYDNLNGSEEKSSRAMKSSMSKQLGKPNSSNVNMPYQSATLLVKKSPTNSSLNSNNANGNDQYSIITTQITKPCYNNYSRRKTFDCLSANRLNGMGESGEAGEDKNILLVPSGGSRMNVNSRLGNVNGRDGVLVLKTSHVHQGANQAWPVSNQHQCNTATIESNIKPKSSHFDSNLLTPLTPLSHSLKQQQYTTTTNTTTQSNCNNNPVSTNNISSPILVPFESFYLNNTQRLNQTTSASNCQYLNNKNFKYTRKSSANENIDESNAPKAYLNAQHTNATNKSASTSYLLSKISSLASLTMPKNKLSTTPTTNLSTSSSVSSSSHGCTTSPLSSHQQTGLMTNLASKFFNRKNSQQQLEASSYILSSSSSNSIGSPNIIHPNDLDQRMSAASSPLAFSIELSNAEATSKPRLNKQLASASSSSSACSSSSSTSNLNATTTPAAPTHHVTSSRRPFKKRSQSTHANLDKKLWFYNESDGCWFTASPIQIEASEHEQSSSKSALLKRKQFLSKLNKSVNVSASNIQPANKCSASSKVKLNRIYIKYLTLIELKYLKQLCFNKLQKQFESLQLAKSVSKSNLNSNSSTSMLANQSQQTNAGFVRISIPKDDSMKTIKTKNISIRSKSVDFKFFDDIKENYFFKKNPKESNEQVFGQTLYKCILNDLQQSANRLSKSVKSTKSNSNTSSAQNILNQKWKLKNHNNLLIASKFDLNLLNSLDIVNLNNNPPAENTTTATCPTETSSDSLFSKRNSVLFEALDLKNVERLNSKLDMNKKQPSHQKPNEQTTIINNQNLSIRSEGLVPNIVKSCCKHISEHGLDVVGIFRIDSSKKRIKEIKEMYDTGKEVVLDESFNPNDAACVLKEYLRSLPEPLLTRDLYSGFLATTKIKDSAQRLEAVRHLICLLPVPNRDTLQVLLKLLDNVRNHSSPVLNENETQTGGNKMDAFNLAMVFGPNLLKKHKVSQTQSNNPNLSDKYSLIDDIDSVISVTKYLIENQNSIFYIEADLHNELIQTIDSVSPDEINAILTRKIVASIGVSVENNEMSSDSSGYDSSIKSNLAASTISTDNSDSGTLKRQFNDESSSVTSTSCSYSNFIDTNPNLKRTSRTKLHKIANFGQTSSSNLQPISFLSSPTHSPTRATNKPSKRVSSNAHESSKENVYKNFSNELYNNLNGIETQATSKPKFVSNNPASVSSSSLLLMINNNNNSNQNKHLVKTGANKYSVNDENVYNTTNQVQQQIIKFNSKPAKSLLNLNSNDIVNSGEQAASDRRQSASGAHGQQQFKIINANTIQICSKFYDKSKFNIIGEQETLV